MNQEMQENFLKWKNKLEEILIKCECPIRALDEYLLVRFLEGETVENICLEFLLASMASKLTNFENIPFDEGCLFKKGTRVIKTKKKIGDKTEMGREGTLLGFSDIGTLGGIYLINFDGDNFLNGVTIDSIEAI